MKFGRNELCPCGSGKKYKRCCGLTGGSDSLSGSAPEDAAETWWFGYPKFSKKVYREFADYFEAVLVPTGELCRDALEAANRKMTGLQDSVTPLELVIFHLAFFAVQAHQEAVLLVGHGLSNGAIKVLRGMFEAVVAAEYLSKNPDEIANYRDYHKVILWKRYQYLARVEPEKTKQKVSQERVSQILADYEAVKDRFPKRHQWNQKKGVKEMAEGVGLGDTYDWFYCSASSLHHANMEALHSHFMKVEETGVAIGPSLSGCGPALAVADLMVFESLRTLDSCLGLGFAARLAELKEKSDSEWARRAAGLGGVRFSDAGNSSKIVN